MSHLRVGLITGLIVTLIGGLTGTAFGQDRKGPPSCAAITFRPLGSGLQDGTQDAGLYRSRYGKVVLRAEVTAGQAKTYFIEVNGKRLEPLKGSLPDTVNTCLNSKHVKTPPPPAGASCIGDRFRVVLNTAGKQKYVMLFGLQGETWKLCSASQT